MKKIKLQMLEYLGRSSIFFTIFYIARNTIPELIHNNITYFIGSILAFIWVFLPFFKD